MTESTTKSSNSKPKARQILFVLGLRNDWGLYMPALLDLARETNANIHLLETGAPLGTGSFTSTAVMDGTQPKIETPQPDNTIAIEPRLSENPNLAPADTLEVAMQTSSFIQELLTYFQESGFPATGDWKPEFDSNHLGDYASRIGAQIIAIPRPSFIAGLFQNALVSQLEAQGFRVEMLNEISNTELEILKSQTSNSAGGKRMSTDQITIHKLNQKTKKPETQPIHDTDLSSKPPGEREQLLDNERREEMNDHDEARVDGKHYSNPDQAQTVKEADIGEHASDHLGARDEDMDRTQGPPAMGGNPAPGKGERPIPAAK